LFVGNASLHRCIKIARTNPQDLVHSREVDSHTALQGYDMAFQTSATPKRDNRNLVARAQLDDLAHFLGGFCECHRVRLYTPMIGCIMAMLLSHQYNGREAIA
jgi:hypothetical protein